MTIEQKWQTVSFVLAALVEYKEISKKTLQDSIESEMSGDLEKLLVAVGEECCPSLISGYGNCTF